MSDYPIRGGGSYKEGKSNEIPPKQRLAGMYSYKKQLCNVINALKFALC
jgi:hypothetical protein